MALFAFVVFVLHVIGVGVGLTGRARGALGRFGDDLDVKLLATFCGDFIDQPGQRRQMGHLGSFFNAAEAAVKIPKISAFWQIAAALALDVFSNFVLDGIKHAVAVFAFDVELEYFSHARW